MNSEVGMRNAENKKRRRVQGEKLKAEGSKLKVKK
jgi:hypothetical protein